MRVLIGIQARSGSTRLPRKAFELISGRMMLDHVIGAAHTAAKIIKDKGHACTVAVLTPEGDPILEEFSGRVDLFPGPEFDVLDRYRRAVEHYDPDYIVRVTGDCPLLPGQHISYLTLLGVTKLYDYISNGDERFRTALDGDDCEVISRRLFDETAAMAHSKYDREHVTTWIRSNPPIWAQMALAMSHFDLSNLKLSVDTKEDLERVRKYFASAYAKYQGAMKIYGMKAIHRI